ncbi:MAG TPA: ATP-binding protein [Pyrinomonadaceae bacterium]|nr:ATP-binding protein [Pyrinomonadaceae bacterium]
MGIRPKIFLIFFAFGIVPMLVLVYINYLNGVGAVEVVLRGDVEREATEIARDAEARQRAQETGLVTLARSASLREYVRGTQQQRPPVASSAPNPSLTSKATDATDPRAAGAEAAAATTVPDGVRVDVGAFLLHNRYYAAITCLNVERRVLFRVEPDAQASDGGAGLSYRTLAFPPNINVDERVWSVAGQAPLLRSALTRERSGVIMRYTVPVFTEAEGGSAGRGALVAELKVDALVREAAGSLAEFNAETMRRTAEPELPPRTVVAIDSKGNIIYHTNDALRFQPVGSAMPTFKPVADRMLATESGSAFYDSTAGSRWLAAYRRVAPLDISLAVSGNYSLAVGGLRRSGLLNLIISVLIGVLTSIILTLVVGRMARSIERVTKGAVAIAGGQLDQRIEVRSNDETRLLAESFNKMSNQLGEQIAHEAEMRQFQSFFRLSAMMTHDLKNAIAALSLIVRNMEKRFHHEEFRADAMQSLMLATDKLRVLVAKLSGPVESLSGEYKRPQPTDLIPIIERVMAMTATPAGATHQVEARLAPSLIAYVDGERIERVVENLIINAVEAMGTQSGRLRVEAGHAGDDKVFFSVADTGPGMSQEFINKRLFRAFATTKKRGVGLGLYTCREVVRAHGGQIDVESREGSGTCFRVVLPSGLDHKSYGSL